MALSLEDILNYSHKILHTTSKTSRIFCKINFLMKMMEDC
jgi:hypothetical protein